MSNSGDYSRRNCEGHQKSENNHHCARRNLIKKITDVIKAPRNATPGEMSRPVIAPFPRNGARIRIRRRLRECSAKKLIAWMRKPGSTQKAQSRTQKAQTRWKGEAGDSKEYLCLLCSALRFLCSSSAHSSAYPDADGVQMGRRCAVSYQARGLI
jgi:hypothetical protein